MILKRQVCVLYVERKCVCVCLERDGGYEKRDKVLLCVGSYMCGELGVGVEGEKGVTEETCMYVRDSWGCAR